MQTHFYSIIKFLALTSLPLFFITNKLKLVQIQYVRQSLVALKIPMTIAIIFLSLHHPMTMKPILPYYSVIWAWRK